VTFGEKLYQLRTKKGISQESLAQKLGVSRQAISRWELGEVVPDTANVLAVSRLFNVSTDYLLREECFSDGEIPAVKTAEVELQKRQQMMGAGVFCRLALLAFPALYHMNVRTGDEPEMLPFLYGGAVLFGILLSINSNKLRNFAGKSPKNLLLFDTLAICSICFLPPLLDWIPGNWGVFFSQLAAVPFLQRS